MKQWQKWQQRQRWPGWLLAIALLASGQAEAAGLTARGDAFTAPRGGYSFGVWNPLRYALTDQIELAAHPLIFFVAPHLEARVRHLQLGGWQLTGEYALSLPSPAMRLLQGYLFPEWERGGGEIGWSLVPRVGLLASHGQPAGSVFTLRADVAAGVPLAESDARSLDTLAPLDLLFDPAVAGYRGRVGVLLDRALRARWRWRVLGDVYLHGVDEDHTSGFFTHLTFRAGAGMEVALRPRMRLLFGLFGWNDYQHAVDGDGNPVRSNLLLPVIDLLWSGG